MYVCQILMIKYQNNFYLFSYIFALIIFNLHYIKKPRDISPFSNVKMKFQNAIKLFDNTLCHLIKSNGFLSLFSGMFVYCKNSLN